MRHFWMGVGIITLTALLLELGGDGVRLALAYNRDALEAGQYWRLLTGHFVHLSMTHVLLNLAGLALVAWIVGHAFSWQHWLTITAISIVAIDAGFWILYPELGWYVGMSGLLHGILAAGLVVGIAERERGSIVLGVLVLAKLIWEQTSGPLPGSESSSGGAVIVDAHFYGAVGGLLAVALLWRRVRPTASI